MEESCVVIAPTNEQTPEENNDLASANMCIKRKRSKIKLAQSAYMTPQQEDYFPKTDQDWLFYFRGST
jgi:hypothetical protein